MQYGAHLSSVLVTVAVLSRQPFWCWSVGNVGVCTKPCECGSDMVERDSESCRDCACLSTAASSNATVVFVCGASVTVAGDCCSKGEWPLCLKDKIEDFHSLDLEGDAEPRASPELSGTFVFQVGKWD